MRDELEQIEQTFAEALSAAGASTQAIDAVRVRFLGKKGEVTGLMKRLGEFSSEERPAAGKSINTLKQRIAAALEEALGAAEEQARQLRVERQRVK